MLIFFHFKECFFFLSIWHQFPRKYHFHCTLQILILPPFFISIIWQSFNLFLLRVRNPPQSYQSTLNIFARFTFLIFYWLGIGNQINFTFFSVESTNLYALLNASFAFSSMSSQNNAPIIEHLIGMTEFLYAVCSTEAAWCGIPLCTLWICFIIIG